MYICNASENLNSWRNELLHSWLFVCFHASSRVCIRVDDWIFKTIRWLISDLSWTQHWWAQQRYWFIQRCSLVFGCILFIGVLAYSSYGSLERSTGFNYKFCNLNFKIVYCASAWAFGLGSSTGGSSIAGGSAALSSTLQLGSTKLLYV